MPDESLIELYRLAVPEGAEPTRVSVGYVIAQQREQVAVLFPDGLSILSREIGKQKNGEKFQVVGAKAPFWGIESVDVRVLQDQGAAQPDARMTSSLPREEQLAALQQMREMTGMPDDAYAALVREVEAGGAHGADRHEGTRAEAQCARPEDD
ncbi:hypothetical protein [Kocuria palustris]|uniref:hypothetical protein n=1 Tax=Kocuria palustris TaxID=71999 RepID=UPI0021A5F0EF|nr:hypothetical protein [Kocuria palustris]MCT1591452.1 hypothetical protein [Kocuria palustris]